MRTRTFTVRVTVRGIVEGTPPSLLLSQLLTRPDGKQKVSSQMATIEDAALVARLRSEIVAGMEATVVIETTLSPTEVHTTLKDFTCSRSEESVVLP